MSEHASEHRLSARDVARFVADGLLEFPALVPDALNQRAEALFDDGSAIADTGYRGERYAGRYAGTVLDEILTLPRVAGIIRSLVGRDPIVDHHCLHLMPPRAMTGGAWHADATLDLKRHFDIQLFYFPHRTPREMGGTMFLPGSQFRLVHESEVCRYQNILGQRATVCPAGTIIVGHHNLWHCSQPNTTDRRRQMFKLRLAATEPQVRLFDTADLDDPEIPRILQAAQPWMGSDLRLEYLNRIRLWRHLSGDDRFDAGYWLGRLENDPGRGIARLAREAALV